MTMIRTRGAILSAAALACLLLAACGNGLEPTNTGTQTMTGFRGKITVVSSWPSGDSLVNLRVVAFRNYPPASVLQDFLDGKLEFSDALQTNVQEQEYTIQKDSLSGTFKYIVVAQQYGANPYENWKVVGVYSAPGTKWMPQQLTLQKGSIEDNVDIEVDFYNLPPQPF
jgi:hypothetical protein